MSIAPDAPDTTAHASRTDALHRAHARSIFAFCIQRLRSREEAEDAVQAVFLNAHRSLARGVEPTFQRAWLFKIAERVVLNRQRASSRRARVEFPADLDEIAEVEAHGPISSEYAAFTDALTRLPERQRSALLLHEIQGLSYNEVAAAMGLSPAAVGVLLSRARRNLADELSGTRRRQRGRLVNCLSPIAELRWLLGGLGAKAAAGASLAVVAVAAQTAPNAGPATPKEGGRAAAPRVVIVQSAPTPARGAHAGHHLARPVVARSSRLVTPAAPPAWQAPVSGVPAAEIASAAPAPSEPPPPDTTAAVVTAPGGDGAVDAPDAQHSLSDVPAAAVDPAASAEPSSDPPPDHASSDQGSPSSSQADSHDSGPCASPPCAADRAAEPDAGLGVAQHGSPPHGPPPSPGGQ